MQFFYKLLCKIGRHSPQAWQQEENLSCVESSTCRVCGLLLKRAAHDWEHDEEGLSEESMKLLYEAWINNEIVDKAYYQACREYQGSRTGLLFVCKKCRARKCT